MYLAYTHIQYHSDGTATVYFQNKITGAEKTQVYKTVGAARCAETKFFNRFYRVYGHIDNKKGDTIV
jgi:hypothetical protein